jgi:hypothetical protein
MIQAASSNHTGNVTIDSSVPAEIKKATKGALPPMRAANT